MKFGTRPLKKGEIDLLFTIWQLQYPDGFLRPVDRSDITKTNSWTDPQFYGYYNDLNMRSKSHYIGGGKKYTLLRSHLVTEPQTARILRGLMSFSETHREVCPGGHIPLNQYCEWVESEREIDTAMTNEALRVAAKHHYLRLTNLNGTEYIEIAHRYEIEIEWIDRLATLEI